MKTCQNHTDFFYISIEIDCNTDIMSLKWHNTTSHFVIGTRFAE